MTDTNPLSKFDAFTALSNDQTLFETFETLAVPRQVDTPSHANVRKYIETTFRNLGWSVEFDAFVSKTPMGRRHFTNIVVTSPLPTTPSAPFLVLAAHYDSKFFPPQEDSGKVFIGAIDSAASCAILMNLARALTPHMVSRPEKSLGLKIIFFDGEEAFVYWCPDDSLYGSRHLAEKWETEKGPNGKSLISNIETFVLLDLLGCGNERIPSYYANTQNIYQILVQAEQYLRAKKTIRKKTAARTEAYFVNQFSTTGLPDDHKPFEERGVKIVHVIPHLLPAVWHKFEDDLTAVNRETVSDFEKIFTLFVACSLNLD